MKKLFQFDIFCFSLTNCVIVCHKPFWIFVLQFDDSCFSLAQTKNQIVKLNTHSSNQNSQLTVLVAVFHAYGFIHSHAFFQHSRILLISVLFATFVHHLQRARTGVQGHSWYSVPGGLSLECMDVYRIDHIQFDLVFQKYLS